MDSSEPIAICDSARPRSARAEFIKKVDASEQIIFTVFICPKADAPPLPDLAYWQRTPLSERKFPSSEEYAETHGSSMEDMAAVAIFLGQQGAAVLNQHVGAGTVTVKATAAQVKSTFGVQLNYYRAPAPAATLSNRGGTKGGSKTEIHYGYDGELSLPANLEGRVTHIVGLDNRSIGVPGGFSGDPKNSERLLVTDIAGLYNFPTNIDASDQIIGIFSGEGSDSTGKSLSNYNPADLTQYFQGQIPGYTTAPTLVPIGLTVGSNHYSNDPTNPALELTQDIMTSSTIAQGCTVNVYFSDLTEQGWVVFLNRVLFPQGAEKRPNIVSISWIMYDEITYGSAFSFLFQRLAVVGISVFAIAGDWGANGGITDGKAHVGYPACDPWVTCVGGTVVGNISKGPLVEFDEYAWSDRNNSSSQFTFAGGIGVTGGGMSTVFPTPDYQIAANITQFPDSSSTIRKGGRFIPDIAGMVGYKNFVLNESPNKYFIGTSCSTPLYAGLFAALCSALRRSFGFLNPTLYQLGNTVFRDATFGNNDSCDNPSSPYFKAGIGYDPVTGWGSVDGMKMMNSFAELLSPSSKYVTATKNSFGLAEGERHVSGQSDSAVILRQSGRLPGSGKSSEASGVDCKVVVDVPGCQAKTS